MKNYFKTKDSEAIVDGSLNHSYINNNHANYESVLANKIGNSSRQSTENS
jgi:hypothetical protein